MPASTPRPSSPREPRSRPLSRASATVRGLVERVGTDAHRAAFEQVQETVRAAGVTQLLAVGHRVVHGGERFRAPTVLDDEVVTELQRVSELAPLHNPPALSGIALAPRAWPDLPHIACFDTAWFADLPAAAATYAVDREVAREAGIRRFGMHGLSHQYVGTGPPGCSAGTRPACD